MKDKKLIPFIEDTLAEWIAILGLERWDIQWEYATGGMEDNNPAQIDFHWEYQTALILFNLPVMRERTKKQNVNTVVHELSHLLVGEMENGKKRQTERCVTNIARALQVARVAGRTNPSNPASHPESGPSDSPPPR